MGGAGVRGGQTEQERETERERENERETHNWGMVSRILEVVSGVVRRPFMSGTIKGYQMGAQSNKRKPELVSTAD